MLYPYIYLQIQHFDYVHSTIVSVFIRNDPRTVKLWTEYYMTIIYLLARNKLQFSFLVWCLDVYRSLNFRKINCLILSYRKLILWPIPLSSIWPIGIKNSTAFYFSIVPTVLQKCHQNHYAHIAFQIKLRY